MPKIRNIRHVEIWYNGREDAKLKSETANALANPRQTFNSNKERQEYEAKYTAPAAMLAEAVTLSMMMLQIAVARIKSLLGSAGSTQPVPPFRDAMHNNTTLALFKYFHIPANLRSLPSTDAAWGTVGRILALFETTLAGMRQPYRVYLFEAQNAGGEQVKALGFVTHEKVDGRQPLDIYFRTQPDANGHIPFPHWLQGGDIHISMAAFTQMGASSASVARLLIHEASHKWGCTEDICYKWDTIAQKLRHAEWDKAVDQRITDKAKDLTRKIGSGVQPALERAGRAKPLLPMAKEGVDSDRWVLNADSYAYVAYRLWKAGEKESDLLFGQAT